MWIVWDNGPLSMNFNWSHTECKNSQTNNNNNNIYRKVFRKYLEKVNSKSKSLVLVDRSVGFGFGQTNIGLCACRWIYLSREKENFI